MLTFSHWFLLVPLALLASTTSGIPPLADILPPLRYWPSPSHAPPHPPCRTPHGYSTATSSCTLLTSSFLTSSSSSIEMGVSVSSSIGTLVSVSLALHLFCSCCLRQFWHPFGRSTLHLKSVLMRLPSYPRPQSPATSRPRPWPPIIAQCKADAQLGYGLPNFNCSFLLLCRLALVSYRCFDQLHRQFLQLLHLLRERDPQVNASFALTGRDEVWSDLLAGTVVASAFIGIQLFLKKFSQPRFDSPCRDSSRIHCRSFANRLCSSTGVWEGMTTEATCASRCPFEKHCLQVPHSTFFSAPFGCAAGRGRVLGFGAIQGASERWCLCSNRRARDVRRCREWVSHPLFAARNQVRARERLARARLCFEMSSRPGKKGPSQFTWNKSPKQSAHVRQSVFEPFVCVVCRVPCVVCSV